VDPRGVADHTVEERAMSVPWLVVDMTESTDDIGVPEAVRFGVVFGAAVSLAGLVLGVGALVLLGRSPSASTDIVLQYGIQLFVLWSVFGAVFRYLGGETPL